MSCLLVGLLLISISIGQAWELDTAVFDPEPTDPIPADPHNHENEVLPLGFSTEIKGPQNWAVSSCVNFLMLSSTPAGATTTYFEEMFNRASGARLRCILEREHLITTLLVSPPTLIGLVNITSAVRAHYSFGDR